MSKLFSTLQPDSIAPSLNRDCDKPFGLGFNFMPHYKNLSLENIAEEIDGIIYTEEWKDMEDYNGLYMVSNFGRIKSLGTEDKCHLEKIKCQRAPNNGYLLVSIWKNNKEKKLLVHRIVAKHFIPNPENKKTVNHKYGVKTDNRFVKLEWTTQSENAKHSYDYLDRKCNPVKGKNHSKAKKVNQLSRSGELINTFDTVTDAAKYIGATVSLIARVCRGEEKTAKNFKWEYV